MRYRVPILTILVVTFTTIGMEAAQAAPPTNDNFANATTVTEPLPFTNSVDTTQATVEATDPACAQAGFDPQNTVWYSYTPSTSGFFQANTFGSDYDTTLWVGTGTAGNLSEIACNDDSGADLQSKVVWDASASTTYYIMAGTCCGGGTNGGNLELTIDTSAPQFTIDDLTISGGKVTPKTGQAVISGSITCSNGPDPWNWTSSSLNVSGGRPCRGTASTSSTVPEPNRGASRSCRSTGSSWPGGLTLKPMRSDPTTRSSSRTRRSGSGVTRSRPHPARAGPVGARRAQLRFV